MKARTWLRLRAVLVLLLCCAASGCNLLIDEFTWLDRAAPSTERAPDAPRTGLQELP